MNRLPNLIVGGTVALAVGLVFLITFGVVSSLHPRSRVLSGIPVVTDGDTIKIGSARIRLAGVDAEEMKEPNGPAAKQALIALIAGQYVHCQDNGERSYMRVVARCYFVSGVELNAEIVRIGAALDCARYSGGRYRRMEPSGIRSKLMQKGYC